MGIPQLCLIDTNTGDEVDFLARDKIDEVDGSEVRVMAALHSFAAGKKLSASLAADSAKES